MGDFNAHLGSLGGPRGCGTTNSQGTLLYEFISDANLFPVSLSSLAYGPLYTYSQGEVKTTVDYCLMDSNSAHLIDTCLVHSPHPLNLSDHLPISITLSTEVTTSDTSSPHLSLNWKKAVEDGSILKFQSELSNTLPPILSMPLECTDDVEMQLSAGTRVIQEAALKHIPFRRNKQHVKLYIYDALLKVKCKESNDSWRCWRDAGRPRSGPVYDTMKSKKQDIKVYVNSCRARQTRKHLQQRDTLLRKGSSDGFRVPKKKSKCHKLKVNGTTITGTAELLDTWVTHFNTLAQSQADHHPQISQLESELPLL